MSFRIFFVPLGVAKVLKKSKVFRKMFHVSTELHIFAFENPPEQEMGHPRNTSNTPQYQNGAPLEHFQHPKSVMGYHRNTSNTPSD